MSTRRDLLLSAASMGAAVAAAPLSSPAALAATPRTMAVMAKQIDDVVSLDPGEAYEPTGTEVGGNIYRKLVTPDPKDGMKIAGDLAANWEISSDGKTFTFHLTDTAHFPSGRPVTAEDVAFSLQRAVRMNKAPAFIISQFGFTKDNVGQLIRATDPRTAVLELPEQQATSLVLNCLSANVGSVVEKAIVLEHETNGDLGNAWLKANSAGAGLFKLTSWSASEHIILDANPGAGEQAWVKRIVIQHVKEPATQLLLLRRGDVDIARDLTSDQLASISGDPDFHLISARQATLMYIAMNEAVPELGKPQARQAIKWAIGYQAIAKNVTPHLWSVCQSFVPKGLLGALDGDAFSKDPAKAKQLLSEAGLPRGFSLTMDHIAAAPYNDIAQAIQADMAEVGIVLQLLPGEQKQVITKTRARAHQMAMLNWGSDYFDPNSNAQGFCANPDDSDSSKLKSAAWRSHFVDATLTEEVEQAVRERDAAKRAALYQTMQQQFQERSPFAMILQKNETAVLRRGVTGLQIMPMTSFTKYTIQKS